MFFEIIRFEWRQQLKSPLFWIVVLLAAAAVLVVLWNLVFH